MEFNADCKRVESPANSFKLKFNTQFKLKLNVGWLGELCFD